MGIDIDYPKTGLLKRFVALLIDMVCASVLSLIPHIGWLLGITYVLLRDGFDWKFMKNRSLGKVVMKLKVIVLKGNKKVPDLAVSAKRNFTFIIPLIGFFMILIEGIKVFNDSEGRRFGDTIAGTMVIDESIMAGSDAQVLNAEAIDVEKIVK